MPFFSRKSKNPPTKAWDQAKFEYEEAIQRCYRWNGVTLALCSFEKFQAFNFSYYGNDQRRPFIEGDTTFRGVVHEQFYNETHVLCEVMLQEASDGDDYIGSFRLTHTDIALQKARREEQPLELIVTLNDPTRKLKECLVEGLRDAALSGLRFMHIDLACREPTNQELDKALSDMRQKGYAASRDIISVKMWPKIELQNAPAWARRTA